MSPEWGSRADGWLGGVGIVLFAGAVWSAVLCRRRVWLRARTVAAWVFWLSAFVQVAGALVVPIAVIEDAVELPPDGNVSPMARLLAESVAAGMSATLGAMLANLVATITWMIAVRQIRRAKRASP